MHFQNASLLTLSVNTDQAQIFLPSKLSISPPLPLICYIAVKFMASTAVKRFTRSYLINVINFVNVCNITFSDSLIYRWLLITIS